MANLSEASERLLRKLFESSRSRKELARRLRPDAQPYGFLASDNKRVLLGPRQSGYFFKNFSFRDLGGPFQPYP